MFWRCLSGFIYMRMRIVDLSLKREDFFFLVDGGVDEVVGVILVGTTKLKKRRSSKCSGGWGWIGKKRWIKKDKVNVRKVLQSYYFILTFFNTLENFDDLFLEVNVRKYFDSLHLIWTFPENCCCILRTFLWVLGCVCVCYIRTNKKIRKSE